MKTKHTQEKWYFEMNQYSQVSPRGQFTIKAGEAGTPVCILPIAVGIGIIEALNKQQANAKLIVAAPELLEALIETQKLIEVVRKYMPKSIKNTDKFHFENVVANVINKAINQAINP